MRRVSNHGYQIINWRNTGRRRRKGPPTSEFARGLSGNLALSRRKVLPSSSQHRRSQAMSPRLPDLPRGKHRVFNWVQPSLLQRPKVYLSNRPRSLFPFTLLSTSQRRLCSFHSGRPRTSPPRAISISHSDRRRLSNSRRMRAMRTCQPSTRRPPRSDGVNQGGSCHPSPTTHRLSLENNTAPAIIQVPRPKACTTAQAGNCSQSKVIHTLYEALSHQQIHHSRCRTRE